MAKRLAYWATPVTAAQLEAIKVAVVLYHERTGARANDAARHAMALFCKEQGVEFPEEAPQWGGLRRRDEEG